MNTAITDIHFSAEATAGLITQSALMILIPIALLICWRIKTKQSVVPVIVGAVTWFLFAIILKIAPAYFLLQADNSLAKAISGNVWLACLTAGILAGVFEETGRFLAFRFVLKKYEDKKTSVSYGIGHGGFESVYVGLQIFAFALIGILVNAGMADKITAGADEAALSAFAAQLSQYANVTFGECMLGVFERIPAITVHIAFSVLVFAAVRDKRRFYLYPVSVLLHMLFDFSIVFYQTGMVPAWALELLFALIAAAVACLAWRVYKKLD